MLKTVININTTLIDCPQSANLYLYEISDSGQQVVEGDLGLFQVGLGGAERDALPAPGARCRVGERS